MNRLYVGNIRYTADEASLRALFEAYGPVQEVFIGIDRETGRSRGFAFVTMRDAEGAQAAIAALDGKEVDGRNIVVNAAQPRGSGGGSGGPPGERRGGPGGERPSGPRGSGGAPRGRVGEGRDGPVFRQPPYTGPPPESGAGRSSRGGKPGRDREWERPREQDRERAREKEREQAREWDRGRNRPDRDEEW
ncbi:MAG TPA: hypothetical protein PKC43_04845 [Phycisphaerales bacterium]|nr:hypothetical protein [Phycisphaerales bacterium]HMP36756.1 hypothetical protein [Phycisphaerales bacterium]